MGSLEVPNDSATAEGGAAAAAAVATAGDDSASTPAADAAGDTDAAAAAAAAAGWAIAIHGGAGVINTHNAEWLAATRQGLEAALDAGVKVSRAPAQGRRAAREERSCGSCWPHSPGHRALVLLQSIAHLPTHRCPAAQTP